MAETRPADHLPDELIAELQRLDQAPDSITTRVDRAVAGRARAHFEERQMRRRPRLGAWGSAAAAALLVVVLAMQRLDDHGDGRIYADVDGSGQIDIADVLALARTRDNIARADLDAFAMRIVALDGAGAR